MHLLSKKYGANNMRIKCAFNVHLMRIKCAFSALFREGADVVVIIPSVVKSRLTCKTPSTLVAR